MKNTNNNASISENKQARNWFANKDFRKHAIVLLVMTFILQYVSSVQSDSYNILVIYLPKVFGISETALANAYTIGGIVSIFAGIYIGHLVSKKGPVKMAAVSLVAIGIATIVMAWWSDNVIALTVSWVLSKCMCSGLLYSMATITSNWFIKFKGRALGINTMGGPLETATGVALLTFGCNIIGFSKTFSVAGILFIIAGIIFPFVLKDTPEAYGLLPDGETRTTEKDEVQETVDNPWTLKKIFTTKDSLLLVIGMAFINFAMICMMIYFVPRFVAAGMDQTLVVSALSIGGLCAIPMSYVYGWIDDKFGTPKACVIYAIVLLSSMLAMVYGNNSNVFLVIAGFGVASATGGLPNLHPSISSYVYGQKNFMFCHKYAAAVANVLTAFCATFMAFFGEQAAKATGNPVSGYIKAYWILSGMVLAAVICFALISKKSFDQKKMEREE